MLCQGAVCVCTYAYYAESCNVYEAYGLTVTWTDLSGKDTKLLPVVCECDVQELFIYTDSAITESLSHCEREWVKKTSSVCKTALSGQRVLRKVL